MIPRLLRPFRRLGIELRFVARNVLRWPCFPAFPATTVDGGGAVSVTGCKRSDLGAALRLRAELAGSHLRGGRRLVAWAFASRSIICAIDSAGRVIGMNLYYFRAQDAVDVVHEGYVGVATAFQVQEIGSQLRACAPLSHAGPMNASNLRADNAPSLQVARRLGFREIDARLDADGGQTLLLYRDLIG